MINYRNTLNLVTFAVLVILGGFVQASSLPSHYPADFDKVATIDEINFNTLKVIIGDKVYSLNANVDVNLLRANRTGSFSDLSVGDLVGCILNSDEVTLSEIWMLPEDYEAEE